MKDRPPILTERGWDRRLVAMIALAVALHAIAIVALVWLPGFQLRPRSPEAYDVTIVSLPKGRLPSGLPELEDAGGAPAEGSAAGREAPSEPPPAAPEEALPPAPPPPERPRERADIILPGETEATPTPTPKRTPSPTPRLTASPPPPTVTPRPTASPTPRPRPTATAVPTARPSASPPPRPRATAGAAAVASPRPQVTQARAGAAPISRPTELRSVPPAPPPAAASAPGASSSRDAQIAEALARVKQRIGSGESTAPAAPGVGAGRGPAGAGGSGPPLGPGERLGVPWGSESAPSRGAEFLVYFNEMIERIRSAWVWTGGGRADLEVMVRFGITEQGELINVVLSKSSGNPSYDQSVLQALRAVRRLRPPPPAYRNDFADVELTFRPGDLQSSASPPQ